MIKIQFIKAPNIKYLGQRVLYSDTAILGNDGHFFIKAEDLFLPPIFIHVQPDHLSFKSEYNYKIDFITSEKKLRFPFNLKKDDIIHFGKFSIQILDFYLEQDPEQYSVVTKKNLQSLDENSQKMKLIKGLNELSK